MRGAARAGIAGLNADTGFQVSDEDSWRRRKLYRDAIGAGWASLIPVVVCLPILLRFRDGASDIPIGFPIVATVLFFTAPLNALLAVVLVWRLRRSGHPSFWKPLLLAIPGVLVSSGVTLVLFRDLFSE